MQRPSLPIVFIAIASVLILSEKSMGQAKSGPMIRIEKAKSTFDSEIQKLTALVEQHFAKAEKSLGNQGDLALTSQLASERIDFERSYELPLSILPSIRQRFITARATMFQAYTKAIGDYEPGRLALERNNLEKEFQAFKDRTAGIEIDGARAARIASPLGATNKYQLNKAVAQLAQKANAKIVVQNEKASEEIGIGGVLPTRPFVVTEIHFPEGTAVKDSDLMQISTLSELVKLSVRGSLVTDAGVKHLTVLKKLKAINLHATKITNRSLFMLAEMGTLEEVDIAFNDNITDEGIRALGALSNLRILEYGSQNISPDMIRWIQTKLKK